MPRRSLLATVAGLTVAVLSVSPAFAANYPVPDPTGTLLDTATLTIPQSAKEFTVPGDIEIPLGGVPTCEIEGGKHVYDIQPIEVTIEGEYTFRTIATSSNQTESYPDPWHARFFLGFTGMHPIEDSFVAIFSNGFNPKDPNTGIVGCNDDSAEYWAVVDANDGSSDDEWVNTSDFSGTWVFGTDHITVNDEPVATKMPVFSTHLEPGRYTILITVWEKMSAASWNNGDDGDGFEWTPGDASVETEIWGPTGGATLSDTEWEPEGGSGGSDSDSVSELAATGTTDPTGTALLGVVALIAGAGLVAARRRRA